VKLFDLKGKAAIVTGGNGGIGLGLARGLANAGASVAIAARNPEKTAKAVKELQALGAKAIGLNVDVTKEAEVEKMVADTEKAFGRLDILVNNAGTALRKMPQDYTELDWHRVLDVNLTSAFLCCKHAYPAFKRAGGGKVLNNGSMMSIFGAPWAVPYAASKGGMVQMTKGLATAWAKDNIQVNCFLPGWIDTDLTRGAREQVPGLHEKVLARTPAGRWGTGDDFQGLAVFLASAASDFVTGTAIPIDGGYSSMG
jgi:2-deoxy-D-gluconate 3-dehydrogenase